MQTSIEKTSTAHKPKLEYQTALWAGPEAGIRIFFAVGDMNDIEISVLDAARMIGVSRKQCQEIIQSNDGPIAQGEVLTIGAVSNWVEGRINNVAARKRSRKLEGNAAELIKNLGASKK